MKNCEFRKLFAWPPTGLDLALVAAAVGPLRVFTPGLP